MYVVAIIHDYQEWQMEIKYKNNEFGIFDNNILFVYRDEIHMTSARDVDRWSMVFSYVRKFYNVELHTVVAIKASSYCLIRPKTVLNLN